MRPLSIRRFLDFAKLLSIVQFLKGADPLSPEAIDSIVKHREEDMCVDYKETFHFQDERDWLQLTKDVMAFANTNGGYLVFGVRDQSFDVVGLCDEVVHALADSNRVLQKVNRYVEPEIVELRSRAAELDNKWIVVLFVAASPGVTHMILKDAKYTLPSGHEKVLLHTGTIYVRRSGGNRLATSRDLDEIYAERFEKFQQSLLNKLTKVVQASPDSEILIVNESFDAKKVILSASPDAIEIRGLSFTTPPNTDEAAIASSIAISATLEGTFPNRKTLWQWYQKREKLELSEAQSLSLAKFYLLSGTPVFYWLRKQKRAKVGALILECVSENLELSQVDYILSVGRCLGKPFYKNLLSKFKRFEGRLGLRGKPFPKDIRLSIAPHLIESERKLSKHKSDINFRDEIESALDNIVRSMIESTTFDVMQQLRAQAYDCYLYAQDLSRDQARLTEENLRDTSQIA